MIILLLSSLSHLQAWDGLPPETSFSSHALPQANAEICTRSVSDETCPLWMTSLAPGIAPSSLPLPEHPHAEASLTTLML